MGSSPVTAYIESATGIKEGARTGIAALTACVWFIVALFFNPLIGVCLAHTGCLSMGQPVNEAASGPALGCRQSELLATAAPSLRASWTGITWANAYFLSAAVTRAVKGHDMHADLS